MFSYVRVKTFPLYLNKIEEMWHTCTLYNDVFAVTSVIKWTANIYVESIGGISREEKESSHTGEVRRHTKETGDVRWKRGNTTW